MAKMTPEEIGAKFARNTSAATQDYVRGVQNVTQSPGAAAAAAKEKWQRNTQAAKDKFAANAAAVTTQSWQQATLSKQDRYASGTAAAVSKVADFQRAFQPAQEAITQRVRSMPSTTQEERIQRMLTQVRETAKFQYRK